MANTSLTHNKFIEIKKTSGKILSIKIGVKIGS
ncbi:hypothetical protein X962_5759 [Burkholderia pseudomallei MSHR7343]|nr:hypothetical protein X962_5759 [Burkholderia pseudomallei MSHR7343]